MFLPDAGSVVAAGRRGHGVERPQCGKERNEVRGEQEAEGTNVTRCDHVRPRIVAPCNVLAIMAPLCKGSRLRSRLRGCKVGIRTINNPSVSLASLRLPPSLAQGGQGVPLLQRGAEDVAPYTAFLRIPLIRLASRSTFPTPGEGFWNANTPREEGFSYFIFTQKQDGKNRPALFIHVNSVQMCRCRARNTCRAHEEARRGRRVR